MIAVFNNLRPAFQAIILQIVAAIALYTASRILLKSSGFELPLFWQMVGQGAVAAGLSLLVKQPWWWCFIQLVFAPLVIIALALQLSNWLYLTIFVLLAFIFWNSADDRVPLYLTNSLTAKRLGVVIGENPDVKFIDLGSGLGGTSLSLASEFPKGRFQGVETAPFPLLISKIRSWLPGPANVSFDYGNMWDWNLQTYDVVYCFLSPVPMGRLFGKARAEMQPGTLFISNSFVVPGVQPTEVIAVEDRRKTQLYIYKMP